MPLYDYSCDVCKLTEERFLPMEHKSPVHCSRNMRRLYTVDHYTIDMGYPAFVDRIEEIHKAQSDRGEKRQFVHPSTVRASI
jgi:hypothetical protein